MKCSQCGTDNAPIKKTCTGCGSFLEGCTFNNVSGEYGYRNADGSFNVLDENKQLKQTK